MDVEEGARKRSPRRPIAAVKAGEKLGPLHGVPMTIKRSYNVVGLPDDLGQPGAQGHTRPKTNALRGPAHARRRRHPVRQDQRAADRLADYQSYNDVYGTTNTPWDLTRTPGGSSGGSAAALAAGLTGIEAGSDIGSSIRNPAHYCGVYGHKPTHGVVSGKGHAAGDWASPGADIAVVGPLARGAEDLEIALDVMAGLDEIDGRGLKVDLPRSKRRALRDFKVAVLLDDPHARGRPVGAGRDPEARRLPRQEEGQAQHHGAAGLRHSRHARGLHGSC